MTSSYRRRQRAAAAIAAVLLCAAGCGETPSPERADTNVIPTALPSATPAQGEPDAVVLLIGQSNMAGRAFLTQRDRARVIPCALLLDTHGRWEPARHPLNRYATNPLVDPARDDRGYGLGGAFATTLCEQLPGLTLGLIVNARSASGIGVWSKGGRLYEGTLERVRSRPGLRVAAVLWHQGESNVGDPTYLGRLEQLVRDLRRDLGDRDLPVVVGELAGPSPINDLLARLPERVPNVAVASARALTTFDGQHFDRRSQAVLGRRYAEALLGLMQGGGRSHDASPSE